MHLLYKLVSESDVSDLLDLVGIVINRYTTTYAFAEDQYLKDFLGYQIKQAKQLCEAVKTAPSVSVITDDNYNPLDPPAFTIPGTEPHEAEHKTNPRKDVW